MRKSASEIIRNLEMRIARLERQSVEAPEPKVGDILFSSIGSSNRTVRFYEVIRTNGRSVLVHQLEIDEFDVERDDGYPASDVGWVLPTNRKDRDERPMGDFKVHPQSRTEYKVYLSAHETAYLWDGSKKRFRKVI
tara:strand:+ start:136 stop:543 length:408 start_codon:yes stop_codon:yes gene_type:complete